MKEHEKRYKTCVKLHNLKKCRFMRSTGDWSKLPRNKLQNMHFRLGKNAYYAYPEIDEKTLQFVF